MKRPLKIGPNGLVETTSRSEAAHLDHRLQGRPEPASAQAPNDNRGRHHEIEGDVPSLYLGDVPSLYLFSSSKSKSSSSASKRAKKARRRSGRLKKSRLGSGRVG